LTQISNLRSKVHVSGQTLELLNGEYQHENGTEAARNDAFLIKNNINTYLVTPPTVNGIKDDHVSPSLDILSRWLLLFTCFGPQAQTVRRTSSEDNAIKRPTQRATVKRRSELLIAELSASCVIYALTSPLTSPLSFKTAHGEHSIPNRKNFMLNSMEQFRDIMKQTNIEMERELERMPIGKFQ
jgi:hypothetical protein